MDKDQEVKDQQQVDESKDEQVDTQEDQSTEQEEKTYTQDEVEKLIKGNVDRAVKKAHKDAEQAFQEKQDEAEKLRKMNSEQKAEYEKEKQEKRIAELEAQINRHGLEKEATQMLNDEGLPVRDEVLDYVVRDNADETQVAVSSFVELINNVADEKVKQMLAGKTPSSMDGGHSTPTKEDFNQMSISERNKLYQDNPELYKSLQN